jgi:hypothetical protein
LLDIDDSFGNWLAGFIDGEACFIIAKGKSPNGKFHYTCTFSLTLRDDDTDILVEIAKRTGLGCVRHCYDHLFIWSVGAKKDTLVLCEILEKYPLRSKKKRDFDIWKEGVKLSCAHKRNGDWSDIEKLKYKLSDMRKYQSNKAA